jgi:hypothetical protein
VNGRLLTTLVPRDSYFNPPGVTDTVTAASRRIAEFSIPESGIRCGRRGARAPEKNGQQQRRGREQNSVVDDADHPELHSSKGNPAPPCRGKHAAGDHQPSDPHLEPVPPNSGFAPVTSATRLRPVLTRVLYWLVEQILYATAPTRFVRQLRRVLANTAEYADKWR